MSLTTICSGIKTLWPQIVVYIRNIEIIVFLLFLRRLALATQIFGDQNHFSDGKLPD